MNLLKNPNFETVVRGKVVPGFDDWTLTGHTWRTSKKTANPSPNHTAAEVDQDWGSAIVNGVKTRIKVGWMYGDEGWLSQEVQVAEPHTKVSFTITEIHHLTESEVDIKLYGDGEVIWERIGLSTIPPANTGTDWYTNTYTINSNHSTYKLEFHAKYLSQEGTDGWKKTLLKLEVE